MGDSEFLNDVCDANQLSLVWLCFSLISVVLLFFSCPYIAAVERSCCMCGKGFIVSDVVRLIADILLVVILGFNAAGSDQYDTRMNLFILSIITTVIFTFVRDVYLALLGMGVTSITDESNKYMKKFELAGIGSGIPIFILFIICMCVDVDCRPWLLPPNVLTWVFYFGALCFTTIAKIPDSHVNSLIFAKVLEFSIAWVVILLLIVAGIVGFIAGMSYEGDGTSGTSPGWYGVDTAIAVLISLLVSTSFGMGMLEYQRLVEVSKETAQEVLPETGSNDQASRSGSFDIV